MRRLCAALLLVAAAAHAGVVVDRDGIVRRGATEVRTEAGTVKVGSKTLDLAEVFLVEDDAGALLYAPDFRARIRGYEYLAHDLVRDEYVKVVREALQVGDIGTARLALEKAEDAGLASREAIQLKMRVDKPSSAGDESRRLFEMVQRIDARYGEFLAERARVAIENRDASGARLLREALRRSPDSAQAMALLVAMAPAEFALGGPKSWIHWHLDLEAAGGTHISHAPGLAWAQGAWRKDVHAVAAGPILMVTPVRKSLPVGRCLAFGRLGLSALEEIFRTDRPVHVATEPMLVLLFPDREDYLATSSEGDTEARSFLEWTAGHYDPERKVSRFFWTDDADAERRLVGTLVHELTHQWLEERNPRAAASDQNALLPGYWIVEGFATFMEEGIYDAATRQWDLFNPRSRSLDVLQAADTRQLIPWNTLYELNQPAFGMLPPEEPTRVNLRWSLRPTLVSARRMFYEQAGATCQFLYHGEDGAYRARLIEFVCNYYTARGDELDPKRAFGLTPKQLGDKVTAFAKAVAGGWRPVAR